jgi:hypothetical protein
MRVREIDLYPVNSLCLVLLLGLKNQLLQDGIIPSHNATKMLAPNATPHTELNIPDRKHFTATTISFPTPSYTQPMSSIVNGVRGVRRRLEHHSSLDLSRDLIFLIILVPERIIRYPR